MRREFVTIREHLRQDIIYDDKRDCNVNPRSLRVALHVLYRLRSIRILGLTNPHIHQLYLDVFDMSSRDLVRINLLPTRSNPAGLGLDGLQWSRS